jgi:hypothetical protein
MKIKKEPLEPYHKRIKVTDSDLCCKIRPEIQCVFCKELMCKDCGRAWSGRKHFLLDLCRSRFSAAQIKESNECFKRRIVGGKIPSRLGECFICTVRSSIMDTDRMRLDKLRHK